MKDILSENSKKYPKAVTELIRQSVCYFINTISQYIKKINKKKIMYETASVV
jgi:hypothetical protein